MINSKQKGKSGELEFAQYLRNHYGVEARRGQQFRGGADSPDIVSDLPLHFEVKRVEKLNLSAAMSQAERDCGQSVPVVAHRRNREPWLITLRADDMLKFSEAIVKHADPDKELPFY